MGIQVQRQGAVVRGKRGGHHTLEQRFRFDGAGAGQVGEALMTKPLVGEGSVFGARPGAEESAPAESRVLRGFSPAPSFRFDVHMRRIESGIFVVRFEQRDRAVPYLRGEFVWFVEDEQGGAAIFDEQVNTPRAMEHAREPLGGSRPSLRRWMFFQVGHRKVMEGAMKNIASLIRS